MKLPPGTRIKIVVENAQENISSMAIFKPKYFTFKITVTRTEGITPHGVFIPGVKLTSPESKNFTTKLFTITKTAIFEKWTSTSDLMASYKPWIDWMKGIVKEEFNDITTEE